MSEVAATGAAEQPVRRTRTKTIRRAVVFFLLCLAAWAGIAIGLIVMLEDVFGPTEEPLGILFIPAPELVGHGITPGAADALRGTEA